MAAKRKPAITGLPSSDDNNDWMPTNIIGIGKKPNYSSKPKPKSKPSAPPKPSAKNGPDSKRPQPKGPRGEKPVTSVPFGYKPNWKVPAGTAWKKNSPWNPKNAPKKNHGSSGGGTPATKKVK